ncbi:MAG: ATP-binding protein [Nostoc sp.]|uniref:ATP-binding protein n=1 Tax=Nostoc sp. TaxID=1180 RepID=UPI002FF87251
MVEQRFFDLELLKKPSLEKLAYFKGITVPHRNLKEVLNELKANILEPADTSVFFVFGVTGIGKSTLIKRLQKILLEDFLEDLLSNPGQIGVASVEASSPSQGKFNHSDYYIRALESLNEVLINYKVDYGIFETERSYDSKSIVPTVIKNTSTLRRAMEKVFINRQLRVFIVDEAQHLFATAGGHQLLNQMNWIKSIANFTKTIHILVGTYELLNCSTISGQIGRRSQDIHIARYHELLQEDVIEYSTVIQTLQRHLPLLEEPQLETQCEYLLQYSIGCVGMLKSWLVRALRISIEENATTLTLKHLKKAEFSASRRKQILEEAEAGEKRLQSDDKSDSAASLQRQQNTNPNLQSQGVGNRRPKRDLVGGN